MNIKFFSFKNALMLCLFLNLASYGGVPTVVNGTIHNDFGNGPGGNAIKLQEYSDHEYYIRKPPDTVGYDGFAKFEFDYSANLKKSLKASVFQPFTITYFREGHPEDTCVFEFATYNEEDNSICWARKRPQHTGNAACSATAKKVGDECQADFNFGPLDPEKP